jgi:hypothetical protein
MGTRIFARLYSICSVTRCRHGNLALQVKQLAADRRIAEAGAGDLEVVGAVLPFPDEAPTECAAGAGTPHVDRDSACQHRSV